MQQYRCPGSATEEYEVTAWDGFSYTSRNKARCMRCGKCVSLYPFGSRVMREMKDVDGWRLKTHYAGRRRLTGGSTLTGRAARIVGH